MVKADDEPQLKNICENLCEDTDQMWRAIFMSMTLDRDWSKEMAKSLLDEWFKEL